MNPITSPSKTAAGVSEALALLQSGNSRLVSIFGSIEDDGARRVHYIIDVDNREYRLFGERVEGTVRSATPITPAAAWYERELHDLYGIEIEGHPNLQPLVFHENWPVRRSPPPQPNPVFPHSRTSTTF